MGTTLAPPKPDEKGWAARWQGGCGASGNLVTNLLEGRNGKTKFPDAQRRQHQLIGKVVDAALVTAVYKDINEGHSARHFARLLNLSGKHSHPNDPRSRETPEAPIALEEIDQEIQDVKVKWEAEEIEAQQKQRKAKAEGRAPDSTPRPTLQDALMEYAISLHKRRYIKTHYDMAPDGAWEKFIEARTQGAEQWDNYHTAYQQWTNDGRPQGWEPTRPYLSPNPDDPRRLACNELIHRWMEIPPCSAKTPTSLQRKIGQRSGHVSSDCEMAGKIRDVNRIMIIPDVPSTADDFLTVLQHLNKEKKVTVKNEHGSTVEHVPRVFTLPWEVKTRNGYFDRMTYLVLDKPEHKPGERGDRVSQGVNGMVCEIKIIGRQMAKVDGLTHALKDGLDAIEKGHRSFYEHKAKPVTQSASDAAATDAEQRHALANLTMSLKASRIAFEKEVDRLYPPDKRPAKLPEKYKFPEYPADPKDKRWNRNDTYDNLYRALRDKSLQINIDALNMEGGDRRQWGEKFLEVVYTQQAEKKEMERSRKGVDKPSRSKSQMNDDVLDTATLQKIGAQSGHADKPWHEGIKARATASVRERLRPNGNGDHSR